MGRSKPFLRETPIDKAFRYRGVIAVVSVPVLLIVLVAGLMPRAAVDLHDPHPEAGGLTASEGSGSMRYAVVLDAGSTGSRVHSYRFRSSAKGVLTLVDDTFEQLKPGLSSFAEDPAAGGASLAPLMKSAVAAVPKDAHASTPVELRATAGLRLLPSDAAEALLDAARDVLTASPFSVADDSVSIMDGADEGAYQWVTINYLLGRLGDRPSNTVAAVDLGGGSVQMAYALSQEYGVYVHSYLGLGLMAARAAVLGAEAGENPCVAPGSSLNYAYAGKTHTAQGRAADDTPASCAALVKGVLGSDQPCSAGPADECGFAGVWSGGSSSKHNSLYLSSYFFDRAQQVGLLGDDDITGTTTPAALRAAAARACGAASAAAVEEEFPTADGEYLCMDLMFQHSLLTVGFGMADDSKLVLVKRLPYHGTEIEAAWPLGAAINSLG